MEETYDPKLIEVYRTEKSEESNTIVPYLGNDFYVKNKKVSTVTDLNKVLKQYNGPAGKTTISDSVSISNSYTATGEITADILKAQLGYPAFLYRAGILLGSTLVHPIPVEQ